MEYDARGRSVHQSISCMMVRQQLLSNETGRDSAIERDGREKILDMHETTRTKNEDVIVRLVTH